MQSVGLTNNSGNLNLPINIEKIRSVDDAVIAVKRFPEMKYEIIKDLKKDCTTYVSVRKHKKKSTCYIVKILPMNRYNDLDSIIKEINIGKKLNGDNFAKTYKNYTDGKGSHYLLIEYIENGMTLKTFIHKHERFKIAKEDFKNIVTQLFKGILYALKNDICPVDIHNENILIDFDHKVTYIDYGKYVERENIEDFHTVTLESMLRTHLIALIQITYDNKDFISWEEQLWGDPKISKDLLIKHYTDLLDHPYLKQIKDL